MQEITNKECYWIAHNGSDIVHYGQIGIDQIVTTSQPTLEEFEAKQDWIDRLEVLGITIEE